MNPDEYDEWAMQVAAERADRRRRWMVGFILVAMVAFVLTPVIQAFA